MVHKQSSKILCDALVENNVSLNKEIKKTKYIL